MGTNTLTRAWLTLLGLSFGSALLTMMPVPPAMLGGGILLLALIKTRVILAHYLDLATSPGWLRGFTMVAAGFAAVIFVLYLV